MSLTVGISNAVVINIGGKSPSAVDPLSGTTSETATQGLGLEEDSKKSVRLGDDAQRGATADSAGSTQSIAVQLLLKRMQELQQQLREQQQQLAATQAQSFQSPEAKATAVMAIQVQISDTSAALMQVAASLAKELTNAGNLVSTTA